MDKIKWEAGECRKEEGCQGFIIMKDAAEERTYHLIQTFDDKAAVAVHLAGENLKVIIALKEAGKFEIVTRSEAAGWDK